MFSRFKDNNLERESAYLSFVVNEFRFGFMLVLQLMIKFHIWVTGFLFFSCVMAVPVLVSLFHENQAVGSYGRNTIEEGNWSTLNFVGFMKFWKDGFMMIFWI